jgi:uncharacterized protein (TIGR03067 family)
MRPFALACVAAGLFVVHGTSVASGPEKAGPRHIAELVARLGDEEFAAREAATAELERIGEPALPALRRAIATSDDLEICHRAEDLVGRMDARAAARELTRLEGAWAGVTSWENGQEKALEGDDAVRLTLRAGESVAANGRGAETCRCVWRVVDGTGTPGKIDLLTADGRTFRMIYVLDGDTLKYCGAYADNESGRPADFSTRDGDGRYMITLKRTK